ncbi:DUF4357 domain-containing protein [Ileibacterium valens]|uniref:DUF4357 domain-containing protein n=1 Tax=Ileibacterium valens TaxID=1862668 RepID=UPI00259BD1B5|nr:DUF4357 domain-containing protein [Ileibacterium valens]
MAKGIVYVMSTVVNGLVKIGKTQTGQFSNRMNSLERNGYFNVVGLKREFAIEVEDYDEKEILLDDIFSKSRIENSELFAVDLNLIIQLLSSFEGRQVYPVTETKEQVFDKVTEEREKKDYYKIPDGIYFLETKNKQFGLIKATMEVQDGKFIIKKGSNCLPVTEGYCPSKRNEAITKDNVLQNDIICDSPSIAAFIARGKNTNGWTIWKNASGKPIDTYRKNNE